MRCSKTLLSRVRKANAQRERPCRKRRSLPECVEAPVRDDVIDKPLYDAGKHQDEGGARDGEGELQRRHAPVRTTKVKNPPQRGAVRH